MDALGEPTRDVGVFHDSAVTIKGDRRLAWVFRKVTDFDRKSP